MSDNLPPLPMAFATLHHDDGYFTMLKRDDNMGRVFRTNVFTAEQMHAYVEADRVSRDVPTDLSLPMFVSRLENMERNGDKWLTVQAVLALLSDCQYLESLTASPQPQPVQAQPSERCPNCDDTGDVHSIDGEWRGVCHCNAGKSINAQANPSTDSIVQAAVIRALDEANVRNDVLRGMCIEVALENARDMAEGLK